MFPHATQLTLFDNWIDRANSKWWTNFSIWLNFKVQWNSVITNKYLGKIGHFSTQMNPVITNKNGRSRAVRYNRLWLCHLSQKSHFRIIVCSFKREMKLIVGNCYLFESKRNITQICEALKVESFKSGCHKQLCIS